jgi:outer membrane protein
MIDVRRAQVDKGTADVSLLQAQQNVEIEVLRLYRLLGVPAPEPAQVEPTDTFPVIAPPWSQDSLVALALARNPVLLALRSRAGAAAWNTRAAYSEFAPSLQASASYGKFRQTSWDQATDAVTHLPYGPDTVVSKSTGTSPWNIRVGFYFPIYSQFQRTVAVAQARASEDMLDLSIRARELQVRADVSAAYVALDVAYRTIAVQQGNRTAADEALSLATERYRVGSGSILELLDARVASETAGWNYITAVYNYHKAIAALEQAVGRTLR